MKLDKSTCLSFALSLFYLLLTGCQNNDNLQEIVGTLEWDRIELTNEVSEPITEIISHEGQHVKNNDLILEFDKRRVQADLNNAIAIHDQLAFKLKELESGARVEELEQAHQSVEQAKSSSHLAEIELSRIKSLFNKKLTSQTELDKATAEYERSSAQLALQQARLKELQAGVRQEQVKQAQKALQAADSQVQHHKINLQHLSIRAPQDGIVDSLPYKAGEQPPRGSVVAVILTGQHPYARIYIPEQIRAQINPGKTAKVFVDGISQAFNAKVRTVSHDPAFTPYFSLTETDRSRLAYLAKVDLVDHSASELPAGLPLKVVFDLSDTGAAEKALEENR